MSICKKKPTTMEQSEYYVQFSSCDNDKVTKGDYIVTKGASSSPSYFLVFFKNAGFTKGRNREEEERRRQGKNKKE